MPAVVAAVIAEVTDIGSGVAVRPAADEAPLGVGGMRKPRGAMPGIVEAEDDRAVPLTSQISDLEGRRRSPREPWSRKLAHCRAPALRDQLQLAVPVELVTEQVPQANRAWPDTLGDLGEGTFVHLEEAQLRAALREERGGDPGDEIGSRAVVCKAGAGSEDLRGHRRGRRLAVGGRDQRRPEREPGREPVDCARVEQREQLPGHVVPPPAPTSLDSPAAARAAAIPATRGTRGRTS